MQHDRRVTDTMKLDLPGEQFNHQGVMVDHLKFSRYNDNPLNSLIVSGFKLKVDGTVGRARAERHLSGEQVRNALPEALYESLRYEGLFKLDDFR